MNVFIDTNVLIDALLARQPFVESAEKIWFLAERGKICGQVSVLSFPNIHYIVRKLNGHAVAMSMMAMLRDTFIPVSCTEQILHQAIDAGMKDFEDAIQYFSALHADADCIVSRNLGHFPSTDLQIFSPDEFLAVHSFE